MVRSACFGLALLCLAPTLRAQTATDSAAVRAAALDYVEAFYLGDTLRFQRAVRPEFQKYGWWRGGNGGYSGEAMSWQEALAYINRVRESGRRQPATAIREVELMDLLDQVAAVKVTASWGIDYLLFAKYDGRWMVSHVLWQGPLRPRGR